MRKDWAFIIGVVVVVVAVIGITGYTKVAKKSSANGASPSPTVAGEKTGFFADDAKVMFFYSDYCHWCQKEEQEVLPDLGKEGYRFKPMNVGNNPDLWKQYNIEGTPTFIAANGDKLVGFQDKAKLKAWMDQHK